MQKATNDRPTKSKRATLKQISSLTKEEGLKLLAEIIANNIINKILANENR